MLRRAFPCGSLIRGRARGWIVSPDLTDYLPLSVFLNRSPGKLKALVEAGARAAASPREAVSAADVAGLCLTDAAAVEDVVFGADGIVHAVRVRGAPPQLLVDFSTIGPEPSQAIASRLGRLTSDRWLDAPVSGGVQGAAAGQLIIFCGGEPADVARAHPILRALAERITHVGEVGAGQAVKICNQMIVATLPAILADGFGDSPVLRHFGPRMATGQTGPPTGTIGTMRKDVEAIAAMARQTGVASPLLAGVLQIYRFACTRGLGDNDLVALAARRFTEGDV